MLLSSIRTAIARRFGLVGRSLPLTQEARQQANLRLCSLPVSTLLAKLASASSGLSSEEADRRLREYGPNDATSIKLTPSWVRFLNRFRNPLVAILLLASAVSAITGDVPSFAIITTIVFLSVTLDFVQEMRALNAIEALREKVALRTRARRDNVELTLPATQLVPGDIVYLIAGDLVPADGRLLIARDFCIDQALLTGEPYPVAKRAGDLELPISQIDGAVNAAFAGTSVISGTATLLVCHTGRATALGGIADSLAAKRPPTAFEQDIGRFSTLILRITTFLVLFVLAGSVMFQRDWLESLQFAVALAVGLTPGLLPMILTVTLAHGAVRMARRKVIVKRLAAIHNLGAMDVLCTDKTGTLTEARIKLMRCINVCGAETERVFRLAYLNSYFATGFTNPLDQAILEHKKLSVIRSLKLDEISYDFERRRGSVLIEDDGQRLLIVKGAPEDVIRLSTTLEDKDGVTTPMTVAVRAEILRRFEQIGAEGFRALSIAIRPIELNQDTVDHSDERDLTLVGFSVFVDPPKASAESAIRALAQAGVAVKILTGDNERVAAYVCGKLGIVITGIVAGDMLATMSDDALLVAVSTTNLFCRVTPRQKQRVMQTLKRAGQIVGFLGDGINDAPAIHTADVGVSVDTATGVAKAAAEIILLNKDLTVLHDGVLEGRRTVINADKYILMASSANFGNILSMAIAGLVLPFLPLLPVQVLLTNLIYDFEQIGLPFDHVDKERVERPVHWNIQLIERFMLLMGPISTVFDLITFAALVFLFHASISQFRTGWFVESLVTQILMIFAVRTRHALFASRPHFIVTLLALITAGLTILLPVLPIGPWFGFVVLPAPYFAFLTLAVAGFLIIIETAKRSFYARMSDRSASGRTSA